MFQYLVFVLISFFPFQDADRIRLEQLSLWQLSLDLLQNSSFQEKLDVSPRQDAAIREMRSREEFGRLLSQTMSEKGLSRDEAWVELDPQVGLELAKILSAPQLEGLRVLAIREKYPFGFSPFYDAILLRKCGVTTSDFAHVERELLDISKKASGEVESLRDSATRKTLEALPNNSKQRFVDYAGNKFFPTLRPSSISPIELHRPILTSLGLFARYFEFAEFRKLMPPNEIKQAEDILRTYNTSHARFDEQTKYRSYIEFANETSRLGGLKVKNMLSEETQGAFARTHVTFELQYDFLRAFDRKDVINYLGLTPAERDSVVTTAKKEHQELRAELFKLNEKTFASLTSMLSEKSQEKIHAIFNGVWKVREWDK